MSLDTLSMITTIALIVTLLVCSGGSIGFAIYKHNKNKDEPKDKPKEKIGMTAWILRKILRNEKPLWLTLVQSAIMIITAVLLFISAYIINRYETYGAIYEEENTLPIKNVLANCIEGLENDSARLQQNIENSNTTLDDYNIIVVRFGCKECHEMSDMLIELRETKHAYIVYSRSPIGKKIVDEYNISITPCFIERGEVTYYN